MSSAKKRLTYDIEPELLKEVDRYIKDKKPIKISRNNFFSMAVDYYLKTLKENKGDNKQ
jgi:metal-responsive CopG/Arc/MetJ family transcriptional regulator